MLIEKDYIHEINGVTVEYFYSEINGGGALGFYHGMKTAFDKGGYDAFWMLDDDDAWRVLQIRNGERDKLHTARGNIIYRSNMD